MNHHCPKHASRSDSIHVCAPVRSAADAGPCALVLDGYLWQRDDPLVHHSALCERGRALVLAGGDELHFASRLVDVSPERVVEDLDEMPSLCPACHQGSCGAVTLVFEAPLAQVDCACSPLTVVYTGTDAEMAQAFEELAGRGLIDLDADPTALLCRCHAAARAAACVTRSPRP